MSPKYTARIHRHLPGIQLDVRDKTDEVERARVDHERHDNIATPLIQIRIEGVRIERAVWPSHTLCAAHTISLADDTRLRLAQSVKH